jgi:hypothetical protein
VFGLLLVQRLFVFSVCSRLTQLLLCCSLQSRNGLCAIFAKNGSSLCWLFSKKARMVIFHNKQLKQSGRRGDFRLFWCKLMLALRFCEGTIGEVCVCIASWRALATNGLHGGKMGA